MANDIGHCPKGALVLVARGNGAALGIGALRLFREQDRDLGTQFCQFERAWVGGFVLVGVYLARSDTEDETHRQ